MQTLKVVLNSGTVKEIPFYTAEIIKPHKKTVKIKTGRGRWHKEHKTYSARNIIFSLGGHYHANGHSLTECLDGVFGDTWKRFEII